MTNRQLEKIFQDFLSVYKSRNGDKESADVVQAWRFSKLAHTGQKRLTGEPYVVHPLAAASILLNWNLDKASVVAAILHDAVEDGGATQKDVTENFGEEVAGLVEGVTKVSRVRLRGSQDEEFIENLRKMFLAMAKDLRVVLIKLADRLHNMQTLYALPADKQIKIARETIEVFAPLAERLGMGKVKAQLDDLSFPYVYKAEYEKLKKLSAPHYKKAEVHIKKMKRNLLIALKKQSINAKIDGRKKHFYSLWTKLERPEIKWDFGKIHDIVALRILVGTVAQCYTALGMVHHIYKPVPNLGVSDFIAQPKPNGYRSVHTRVFGPDGRIVEVQIRTNKMHSEAEYGVASHWAYSDAKSKGIKEQVLEEIGVRAEDNKLSWVKQLAQWQQDISDSKEFLRAVKFDALSSRNFVFSPNGDVYDLPKGATPVDYAYAVHTQLGNYIKSAKVDGKVVSLNYKLKSGQVVEIVKSKNPHPPRSDWLNFVMTTSARREIGKYLRKDKR